MAMTAEERQRFLREIRADYTEYYKMLGTVNAETSECSRPDDRVSIHDGIRGSVGFGPLSRMVFSVLEEWMEGQLRAQAALFKEAGDDVEAMEWTRTIAAILSDQGRQEDALAMEEKVLEFRRRVLPEDHPDIGEGHVWSGVACGGVIVGRWIDVFVLRAGLAMGILASTYSALGRHEDALAMNERVLELFRRVLPEDHPDIGEGHVWSGVACVVVIVGRWIDVFVLRAGSAMSQLASTYSAIGRHEDALAMQEKSLELRRRVLPEDHRHIGEGHVWSISLVC